MFNLLLLNFNLLVKDKTDWWNQFYHFSKGSHGYLWVSYSNLKCLAVENCTGLIVIYLNVFCSKSCKLREPQSRKSTSGSQAKNGNLKQSAISLLISREWSTAAVCSTPLSGTTPIENSYHRVGTIHEYIGFLSILVPKQILNYK